MELTVLIGKDGLKFTEVGFGFDVFGDSVHPSLHRFAVVMHDTVDDSALGENNPNRLGRISRPNDEWLDGEVSGTAYDGLGVNIEA